MAYTPFTRSVFLHGGNAGNFNESGSSGAGGGGAGATKGAGGIKGIRDADGDNIESVEDGREVSSVSGVKERRLDDFWRMELKRSVLVLCVVDFFCQTLFCFAGLGQRRSLDKPSSKFDANSKSSHPSYK